MTGSVHASTANVFLALRLVSQAEEPMGVAEISRRLGIPLSTAHRALATLERAGYLRRSAGAKLEIGPRAEKLVLGAFRRFPIREASLPYLRQLAIASGRSASLCVRIGWYSLRLVSIAGGGDVAPQAPRLGQPVLLHADPGARALLAALDEPARAAYLGFVASRKPRLLAEARGVCGELPERAAHRRPWVATSHRRDALHTVSFPLRDAAGAAFAAVAVEGAGPHRTAAEDRKRIEDWSALVSRLEAFLAENPSLFRHPYAHIPPDDVAFA